jgi:hypothetical protein
MSRGWDCLRTAAIIGPVVHSPDDIRGRRSTMKWCWQGKTEELGGKPVLVPLCSPQIPHGLARVGTRASAARGRRLTARAMARPWHSSYGKEWQERERDYSNSCVGIPTWFVSDVRMSRAPNTFGQDTLLAFSTTARLIFRTMFWNKVLRQRMYS